MFTQVLLKSLKYNLEKCVSNLFISNLFHEKIK